MTKQQGYVLIVEDDPDILTLMEASLTFSGYRVATAPNGREGLDAIQKERPAVVIADIMMPKLDGFGLIHRLRLDPQTRDIPVVIITATYVAPDDKEFVLDTGATLFIQKPVDIEKFLATMAEIMEQGMPPVIEPLRDFKFYEGYRIRLETKLDQKFKQIARFEQLLETASDAEDHALRASLRQAINEREELKLLLHQVHKRLEKYTKS